MIPSRRTVIRAVTTWAIAILLSVALLVGIVWFSAHRAHLDLFESADFIAGEAGQIVRAIGGVLLSVLLVWAFILNPLLGVARKGRNYARLLASEPATTLGAGMALYSPVQRAVASVVLGLGGTAFLAWLTFAPPLVKHGENGVVLTVQAASTALAPVLYLPTILSRLLICVVPSLLFYWAVREWPHIPNDKA